MKEPVDEALGEESLSKNAEFLGQAFMLFCKGLSLTRVALALKPDWPGASPRLVQRVAKANGWEESRATYLALHGRVMRDLAGLKPEIIMQLQKMRMALEARGSSLSHSEIFAYRQLCEDLMMYTGQHPKLKENVPLAVSSDVEVQAFLEAVQEVLGPVWRKHKPAIEKVFRRRLEEVGELNKTKGNKGKGRG